ncbi:F-box protein At2g26160-like [Lycium barbarum]|uniref:F-box protein At2g26160-like n=1 Tax=Lycium barbarum TaxID=112863 RepID=UPI00293F380B|nr:F-box protein At2g26160-like [Lycium barbarum]
MANWAELPFDLLVLIAKRVKVMEDFIAFGVVCTSWRAAASKENFDVLAPQVPLLMQVAPHNFDYRELYSLSKQKVSSIFLPEARGVVCFPTEGWLCTMAYNINGAEMNLLHPFSRTQIQLPRLKPLRAQNQGYLNIVVLSASPSLTSNYALVVHYFAHHFYHLAFWRPGDLNWTHIDTKTTWTHIDPRTQDIFRSIIYYKGQFYCATFSGQVFVFDVGGPSIPQPIVEPSLLVRQLIYDSFEFYLIEVSSSLLIVTQFRGDGGEIFAFRVSELDVIRGELKEINTLGNSAIFLGLKGAISIDSSKSTTFKPNHIYFVDGWSDLPNAKAYNLEDKKIESFYPESSLISLTCLPNWVTPSF